MAFNPADGAERIDATSVRQRTWTDGEWERMLAAADERGDHLGMFLRLAWATGARRGELQKLRWSDVTELEHERLGASLWLRETKTGTDRTVFIAKDLYRLLQSHEQQHRREASDLVFPPLHGDLWSVGKPFREARKKAKLHTPDAKFGEVLNIHHIRHTWATRLGDSGATLAQLMAAGGWSTPQIAMRYMKRQEKQAAEAALLIA
jgi:integrase